MTKQTDTDSSVVTARFSIIPVPAKDHLRTAIEERSFSMSATQVDDLLTECEGRGFYQAPFAPDSYLRRAIVDLSITKETFMNAPEVVCSESGYVYTEEDLSGLWNMVEFQRKVAWSTLRVLNGQFAGINRSLQHLERMNLDNHSFDYAWI